MTFSESWKNIYKEVKRGIFIIKNDPAALEKFRTFIMTFIVLMTVSYAGFSLYVEPQEKSFKKKQNEFSAIDSSAPVAVNDMLIVAYQKLLAEEKEVDKRIALMQMRKNIFKEKWEGTADERSFAKIILSKMPETTDLVDDGMDQLIKLEPVKKENYTIFPISLEGETSYLKLYEYLDFLEKSPEVGALDNLLITVKYKDAVESEGPLMYRLKVGRIRIEGSI